MSSVICQYIYIDSIYWLYSIYWHELYHMPVYIYIYTVYTGMSSIICQYIYIYSIYWHELYHMPVYIYIQYILAWALSWQMVCTEFASWYLQLCSEVSGIWNLFKEIQITTLSSNICGHIEPLNSPLLF